MSLTRAQRRAYRLFLDGFDVWVIAVLLSVSQKTAEAMIRATALGRRMAKRA